MSSQTRATTDTGLSLFAEPEAVLQGTQELVGRN